jgi:IclR family transcriptional regulator, KDG regulon repressor
MTSVPARLRSEQEQVARKQASGSVLKALDVIDALAASARPLLLQEVARVVDRPAPSVHRLLRTLELRDWVESVDGRYRLTLKLFDLGTSIVSSIDVVAEARPCLERLCEELDETANMSVRSGSSVVYVAKLESPRSVRLVSQLGMHAPLYCTAMGKVLLAYAEPSERSHLLSDIELEPRAKNTITDRDQLTRELDAVMRRGWAVDNEEFDFGLVCVAAPVFDRHGVVSAAISIAGPTQRLPRRSWQRVAERVTDAAQTISTRLGYGLNRSDT